MNRISTTVCAAIVALGSMAGAVQAQNFDVVGPIVEELAPPPSYCTEDYALGVAYDAGLKGWHLPPSGNTYYLLGQLLSNGQWGGMAINATDCSVMKVVTNPSEQRPWCFYAPNPSIRCGIKVGPLLARLN
jgi:hypothetical protein